MTPKQYQELQILLKDIVVYRNKKVAMDFMKHIRDVANELGAGVRENDLKDEFEKAAAYLIRYYGLLGWKYIIGMGELYRCRR